MSAWVGRDDKGVRLRRRTCGSLSGAGIVFRPGNQTDKDGDVIYEVSQDGCKRRAEALLTCVHHSQAHVVNEDEDMETDEVQELEEKGQVEADKRDAATAGQGAPRPDLSHQAEIVTSPELKGVELRPSTEGTSAAPAPPTQEKETSGAGAVELTDKSEDPTKAM